MYMLKFNCRSSYKQHNMEGKNMMKLRAKYGEMLEQMLNDVNSNVTEANGVLDEKRQEHTVCVNHISELRTTATNASKKFLDVGRALIKMYFQKATPEEVEQVIEPCNTYVQAAGAIPTAQESLNNAKEELYHAQAALIRETSLLSEVAKLQEYLERE